MFKINIYKMNNRINYFEKIRFSTKLNTLSKSDFESYKKSGYFVLRNFLKGNECIAPNPWASTDSAPTGRTSRSRRQRVGSAFADRVQARLAALVTQSSGAAERQTALAAAGRPWRGRRGVRGQQRDAGRGRRFSKSGGRSWRFRG